MSKDIKHFPVNWIDGMKINKNHFIELQHHVEDHLRDARNLTVNHLYYGLLPASLLQPFEYSITIDAHNDLNVLIKNVKIITPAGGRIEVSDYTGTFEQNITLEHNDYEETNYFVLLNVDPFHRIPAGEQNMDEVPPRFPHTLPKYFLTTVLEQEVNTNNIGPLQFPLAKFRANAGTFEIVEDYIPPCTTVNGHPALVQLFETYQSFFKQMEFVAVQLSQKIKFRRQGGDDNLIADIVFDTVEKIAAFLGQTITNIKWNGLNASPASVLENIISLARIMKNSFDSYSGDGKEMLYNYFCEWTDMKTGDYEKLFLNTINISCKNFDIAPTVAQANQFMQKTDHLFSLLNQLDYIGRKRDSGIFVDENVVKSEKNNGSLFGKSNNSDQEKENTSPSFLAD